MKIIKSVLSLLVCTGISSTAFAGSMGPIETTSWTGFYIGANAGYVWQEKLKTKGTPLALNPSNTGEVAIANALATVGTNHFHSNDNGFIGGGEAGYNCQFDDHWVGGLEMDIDGLTQSNTYKTRNKLVSLNGFPEYYAATISISEKLNYLGTVRGRLGYLINPTWLAFASAGFAYGESTNHLFIAAQESLGSRSYAPINVYHAFKKMETGWTVGGGLVWKFRPNWSAKLEGFYYDLDTTRHTYLPQVSFLPIPPIVFGASSMKTGMTAGAIRVGVNYYL